MTVTAPADTAGAVFCGERAVPAGYGPFAFREGRRPPPGLPEPGRELIKFFAEPLDKSLKCVIVLIR